MRYFPFFSLGVIGALFLPSLGINWYSLFSFLVLIFLVGSFRFVKARFLLAFFLGALYSVLWVESALMTQVNSFRQSLSHIPLKIEVVNEGDASLMPIILSDGCWIKKVLISVFLFPIMRKDLGHLVVAGRLWLIYMRL